MLRRSTRIAQRSSNNQDKATSGREIDAPPPTSTFHLFPRLPLEIRQMIWNLTLESRIVEMEYHKDHGFFTTCNLPSALKVCQESRSTIKNSYPECFTSLWHRHGPLLNFSIGVLYITFDFCLVMDRFLSILSQREISSIRSIAIDHNDFESTCNCEACGPSLAGPKNATRFRAALMDLTALKEITIVHDLEYSLGDACEEAGYGWKLDTTLKSKRMRFFKSPPRKFTRFGLSKYDKGYCKSFHFLKGCKHTSVFGLRQNKVLVPMDELEEDTEEI